MERTTDWFPPVLLLCAQAVVWPGFALLRGAGPTAAELLAAALVAGLMAAALTARRARPVPVLGLTAAACAVGAEPLPAGAVAVSGTAGVALALFTVATERDTGTTLLSVGTLASWQLLHSVTLHGLDDRQGLGAVLTTLLYAAAVGTGTQVRRLRATRRRAELRLHRAESERRRLPAAERRRMERELHDVSAHHLTAVVVTVEAALNLRERRPEMADQALEFATTTGREVTGALSAVRAPAPGTESLPSPQERLQELVSGFRALGQPVTCDVDALPAGAVGDAAYGIAREALTNVVRHASGASTTVRCTHGDADTELVVHNAPPETSDTDTNTDPSPGTGLGSGRGLHHLRGRAREVGGSLTSGPTPDGGWTVRAVLPGRAAESVPLSVPRGYRLAQFTAAAGLLLQPLLPTLVIREGTATTGSGVSAGVLFALLATAQALALLSLRRTPRTALVALLVMVWLWPAATAASGYAGPVALPPVLGMLATCVALAAVAARAPEAARPTATAHTGVRSGAARTPEAVLTAVPRSAVPVAATVVHAAAAAVAVLAQGSDPSAWTVAGTVTAVAALAAAAWAFGSWYGRRRRVTRDTHEHRLAASTEEAVRDAWAERRRITAGLETTVLARTAEVVEEAEAGRLTETAERAREALAAMRALLETVRDGEPHPGLRPQPTLQALDLLVHQCRATGRQVEVQLTDRVPKRLPPEVDLAAYRAAEVLLEAGGDEPAVLQVDADTGTLTLTATGVPGAAGTEVREPLAARAAALGGTLTADAVPGTVRLSLPLPVPTVPESPADEVPVPDSAGLADGSDQRDPARQNPPDAGETRRNPR